MGRTVRDVLVRTLENLNNMSFKKFKNKLNDLGSASRIPRCSLETADTDDVADLIIRYYTDNRGILVTLEALEDINENQEAKNLRNALETVTGRAPQESPIGLNRGSIARGPIVESAPSRGEEHFVDRHREELIGRVTLVDPVLEDLYENHLLSGQDRDRIRQMRPYYKQMDEVFCYAASWTSDEKDQFWASLREHNPSLLRSLQRR
ncbi:apoptosis-associated speck-like protein containing a CARD [Anomaloglossus baeobatrachus]|uniref:apoptosis-associated speck-like protein containing a CARD n=1 Tax=Anomaloglossus baeobatrachus TaxID=238106 RepID=UPI003F50BE2C